MGTLSAGDTVFLLFAWVAVKCAIGAVLFAVGFLLGAGWAAPRGDGT